MRNGLRKLAKGLNIDMDKFMPDAIVFAMILTIITFIAGIALTASGPLDMIQYWGKGFWGFLSFSMQMTLIIATGYIVAIASAILGWISWGLGLVAGAILARTV